MKIIKGNLILTEDTIFKESIKVEGDIKGYFNLRVIGDIDARDINARNINAGDINAGDINARNINAWDIICESRIKKSKMAKTFCRIYIKNKSKLKKKEHETN